MTKKIRQPLVKAYVLGDGAQSSNIEPLGEESIFTAAGAIDPPYEPRSLVRMFECSTALRPNVDAYAVNIEGFGHHLVPTIDPEKPDVEDRLRDALMLERFFDDKQPVVADEDVKAALLVLGHEQRYEKLRADLFFDHCCADMSFEELRMRTRQDLEVTGNAYWEVIRNGNGEISQFYHVPSVYMRLMRVDPEYVDLESLEKISALRLGRVSRKRRFRRFVQSVSGQELAYFKEFNDPRHYSAKSGKRYKSAEAMRAKEGQDTACATEIIHFKIPSPVSVYGVPRWVGATLAVVGSRAAEEVNVIYFDNKAVPPLAILVSGGVLATGAKDRIESYIKDKIKGRNNFHSILIVEAEGSGSSIAGAQGARCRIELKPLREAMQEDALFQEYEANNTEKVGNQFRLPKLLRGNMTDFNRATADAALQYAEQQVFQPERNRVDYLVNKYILPQIVGGVRRHVFKSNSPVEKDPPAVAEMLVKLVDSSILTPDEARTILNDVLSVELDTIDADWLRIPPQLLLGGVQPPPTDEEKAAAEAEGKDKTKKPAVALAPTDAVQALTVNEARAAMNLGPLMLPALEGTEPSPDPRGEQLFAEVSKPPAPMQGMMGVPGVPGAPQQLGGQPDPFAGLLGPNMGLEEQAMRIVQIQAMVREIQQRQRQAQLLEARQKDAEVIEVPSSTWAEWFAPDEAAE